MRKVDMSKPRANVTYLYETLRNNAKEQNEGTYRADVLQANVEYFNELNQEIIEIRKQNSPSNVELDAKITKAVALLKILQDEMRLSGQREDRKSLHDSIVPQNNEKERGKKLNEIIKIGKEIKNNSNALYKMEIKNIDKAVESTEEQIVKLQGKINRTKEKITFKENVINLYKKAPSFLQSKSFQAKLSSRQVKLIMIQGKLDYQQKKLAEAMKNGYALIEKKNTRSEAIACIQKGIDSSNIAPPQAAPQALDDWNMPTAPLEQEQVSIVLAKLQEALKHSPERNITATNNDDWDTDDEPLPQDAKIAKTTESLRAALAQFPQQHHESTADIARAFPLTRPSQQKLSQPQQEQPKPVVTNQNEAETPNPVNQDPSIPIAPPAKKF